MDPEGEVARYEYDAFDRRITKIAGGESVETVWAGMQPIEEYRSGVLSSRQTYGIGLDEIVSHLAAGRRSRRGPGSAEGAAPLTRAQQD